MTGTIERVLIVLNEDGTFKAAHAADVRGVAVPVTQDGLAAVLPDVGGLMARIVAAEAAVSTLTQERDSAIAERDNAVSARDALQAKIDATKAKARLSVSPAQARLALKRAGRLAAVQDMIEALPADDDVRIVWDWAVTWERDSPFVDTLGAALGLTGEQIDDLFALAATL